MIRTDQEGWRNSRDIVIEETHRLIREEAYQQAEIYLTDLLKTCASRQFDMILENEFSNTPDQMTSWLDAEIRRHIDDGSCVAMQLELGRNIDDGTEWYCSSFGFTARAFPHVGATLEEVAALAKDGYWPDGFDWTESGGIELGGFGEYIEAVHDLRGATQPDDAIAHTIAELILGVKYHRLISDAAAKTTQGPFWLIVQDNDSYYIPVAVRLANGA